MILKTFKSDNLDIKVFDTRNDMGKAAAADVAACIKETLGRKKEIRMVFAAAPKSAINAFSVPSSLLPAKYAQGMPARSSAFALSCEPWMPWLTVSSSSNSLSGLLR